LHLEFCKRSLKKSTSQWLSRSWKGLCFGWLFLSQNATKISSTL